MPTILVVCTGNVCRSPLAETVLREEGGIVGLTVTSAGTGAVVGRSFCGRALSMRGAAADGWRPQFATALTPEMLDEADLVLAAAYEHRRAVALLRPKARRKTFTLKEASLFISSMVAGGALVELDKSVAGEEKFTSIVRDMNSLRGTGLMHGRNSALTIFQRRAADSAADFEIADGHSGSAREHRRTLEEVNLASHRVGAGLSALLSRFQ